MLDDYAGERVSVGEVFLFDPERVATYYGHDDELHLSFNFATAVHPVARRRPGAASSSGPSRRVAREGWPTWVLSNHDNARVATRLGGDDGRVRARDGAPADPARDAVPLPGRGTRAEDAGSPPIAWSIPGGATDAVRRCRGRLRRTTAGPVGPWLPFAEGAARTPSKPSATTTIRCST